MIGKEQATREQRLAATSLAVALVAIGGCAAPGMVDAPSRNQNSRVDYLVIHFTTENFRDSLALLTEPSDNPVSAHYLIPEPNDPSYERRALKIFQLVPESRRAWHAGQSHWNGEEALNDRSIGIELVNRSRCVAEADDDSAPLAEDHICFFPDFADQQIALLVDLIRGILERYPEIDPTDIVGHADIAPDRKVDPGPRFPWQLLYRAGIGAWYDEEAVVRYWRRFKNDPPPSQTVQRALREYGYHIEITGIDDPTSRRVVRAFQMHFRPSAATGTVDVETASILFALIEKYRPESLDELLDFPPEPPTDRLAPAVPAADR